MLKTLLKLALQLAVLLWLGWWSIFALLTPFNEYAGSKVFVFDCDTTGELAARLGMYLIWLTTVVLLGVSIRIKFWRRERRLWGMNAIALFLSLGSAVRFWEWVQYSQQLQQYCP